MELQGFTFRNLQVGIALFIEIAEGNISVLPC